MLQLEGDQTGTKAPPAIKVSNILHHIDHVTHIFRVLSSDLSGHEYMYDQDIGSQNSKRTCLICKRYTKPRE